MSNRNLERQRLQATMELVFAGSLWGFGFVATIWALRSMGPVAITGWRFALAAGLGFGLAFLNPRTRREITWSYGRLAIWPGLFLGTMLILQTWGLRYTTATKSGFLTTLYVLIVPFMERFWLKKRLGRFHGFAVLIALIGVGLICDLPNELMGAGGSGSAGWNVGDFLTVLCAVMASIHIIWFGRIQSEIRDPFVFNNFQSLWAWIPTLALALIMEPVALPHVDDMSLFGFLMLAIGSTLVAFALQVRAQKILSPSFSSLLFLLESPFATFFGVMILGETLKTTQWVGAGFILLAAGLSTAIGTGEK